VNGDAASAIDRATEISNVMRCYASEGSREVRAFSDIHTALNDTIVTANEESAIQGSNGR
jgi:hypothetical protein